MNNVVIINQENKNHVLNELSIKQFEELNIPIYGTYEEPLFKAKDIGDLLGIEQIRKTIHNLDDKCKIKINAPKSKGKDFEGVNSIVGNSDAWFLTEDGLYEVLFISRKPIAKQFKTWARNTIKEIRLTGKFETQEILLKKSD